MYLKYISFNNLFRVIDPADSSYFRVVDSYSLPPQIDRSTLVLVFNNKIDASSANNKSNYDISIGNKKARIKNIDVKGKRLIIQVKELVSKDQCRIFVSGVKDVNGNEINRRKIAELNQFRELFVQEYNQSPHFRDSCFMKYMPLDNNCISKTISGEKYWMNTPENIKIR
jgi:hypothetical protein